MTWILLTWNFSIMLCTVPVLLAGVGLDRFLFVRIMLGWVDSLIKWVGQGWVQQIRPMSIPDYATTLKESKAIFRQLGIQFYGGGKRWDHCEGFPACHWNLWSRHWVYDSGPLTVPGATVNRPIYIWHFIVHSAAGCARRQIQFVVLCRVYTAESATKCARFLTAAPAMQDPAVNCR